MTVVFGTTDDLASGDFVKTIVYGDSGVGKTRLAATAPKPLLVDFRERGTLSLKGRGVPVLQIDTFDELRTLIGCAANDRPFKFGDHVIDLFEYETLIIDSISAGSEVSVMHDKKTAANLLKVFGDIVDEVTEILCLLKELPNHHVVVTAKLAAVQDEVKKTSFYGPSFPGRKLGPATPYHFDEVWCLDVRPGAPGKPGERFMLCDKTYTHTAKDRSGNLAVEEFPHLDYLFHKCLGKPWQQPTTEAKETK